MNTTTWAAVILITLLIAPTIAQIVGAVLGPIPAFLLGCLLVGFAIGKIWPLLRG